jgi:hypothetical protein
MALTTQEWTDLFTCAGKFVKAINEFRGMAGGYSTPKPNLKTLFDTDLAPTLTTKLRYDTLEGLLNQFEIFKDQGVSWGTDLSNFVTRLISDRTFIVEKLPGLGSGPSTEEILKEIIRAMYTHSTARTVASNTVLVAINAYAASNVGNGKVLLTKYLDGVTPPSIGWLTHELYNDLASEMSASETMVLTCTSDEPNSGRPEGEEVFSLKGQPTSGAIFGWRTEGSGVSTSVSTLNSHQLVTNKDFALWVDDVPTGWTVDAGLAGTHIIEETTDAHIHRGESSLQLKGDGSQASIQISQPIPIGLFTPNKMYCVSCYVKGNASVAAGTLTINFESPSGAYVAGSTLTGGVAEQIVMNAAALAAQTSYGEEYFFIIMPGTIPDDLELVIKWTGTPTNNAPIRIDSLAVGPVTYANGVGMVVLAGSTPWIKNDRIEVAVSNNNQGVFQDFFRRKYRCQLPSSGSPTIADNLAT